MSYSMGAAAHVSGEIVAGVKGIDCSSHNKMSTQSLEAGTGGMMVAPSHGSAPSSGRTPTNTEASGSVKPATRALIWKKYVADAETVLDGGVKVMDQPPDDRVCTVVQEQTSPSL